MRSSGQQVAHGDIRDVPAIENERYRLVGCVHDLSAITRFPATLRVRVNFDAVLGDVDDPVLWNPCFRVQLELPTSVVKQGAVRDLHQKTYVASLRLAP